MIIVYTISVISSFLVIFFGTHIYFRNPKSQRSTLLLITTIMISLLGIFKYNMIHSASRFEATIWAHLSFIWPFIVSTALHFSLLFTEKAKKDVNRIRSAVLIYLPAAILVVTDLITGDISRNLELRPDNNDWHRVFETNPLYIATFIWLTSSVIIFTYLYSTHLLSVKSKVKKNITFYFFAGFMIAGLGGIAGELGPVFISKHMNYLFVPSSVISCIIILYGLIRHYDYSFKSPEAADIIIDTISDALIYITPDLEVQPVNSAALNLFGWNEIENTRLPIKSFLPENPEYGQALRPVDSFEQLVDKLDSKEVWTSLISRDKTEIAVSVSGRVIKKHNKNPMGLLLTVKDIREKIKDKHKIKLSNHRYYELLQNLPLGIIRVDTEGKILDVNSELVEMLGSPSPEETKKINMFTYPPLIESGLSEDLMKCFRSEDKLTGERRYKTKWGKELYIKYYLLPLFDDKNQCTSVQAIV
ncbi:MAG: PAS domain S-box protein, partial [Chitinivibrionales bacterium]